MISEMRVTDAMVNKALDTLIEYGVLSFDTSIELDTAATRAAIEAALSHAAGQEGGKEDNSLLLPELRAQLEPHANKDCRDCDGSGVFYGNVCVCHCIIRKLAPAQPPANEEVGSDD